MLEAPGKSTQLALAPVQSSLARVIPPAARDAGPARLTPDLRFCPQEIPRVAPETCRADADRRNIDRYSAQWRMLPLSR